MFAVSGWPPGCGFFHWRRRGDPSNGKLLGAASKPSALMVGNVVDIVEINLIHGKASFDFFEGALSLPVSRLYHTGTTM